MRMFQLIICFEQIQLQRKTEKINEKTNPISCIEFQSTRRIHLLGSFLAPALAFQAEKKNAQENSQVNRYLS